MVPISLSPILRFNLRLSLIQCLLSLVLSLTGQVNFPFMDLLEMISISQRMHKIQFSIPFPSRVWPKKRCCNRFSVQLNLSCPKAWTTWHVIYSSFLWASVTEQNETLLAADLRLLLDASEFVIPLALPEIMVTSSEDRRSGLLSGTSIGLCSVFLEKSVRLGS